MDLAEYDAFRVQLPEKLEDKSWRAGGRRLTTEDLKRVMVGLYLRTSQPGDFFSASSDRRCDAAQKKLKKAGLIEFDRFLREWTLTEEGRKAVTTRGGSRA